MSRRQKDPLRPLTARRAPVSGEGGAGTERTGQSCGPGTGAAGGGGGAVVHGGGAGGRTAGGRCGGPVSGAVQSAGLCGGGGGAWRGPQIVYTAAVQERILAEARRPPDREQDQTATWSLTLLQKALRRAPDGLPQVSRYTIWCVLRDAGWRWQKSRSWCETGTVERLRAGQVVTCDGPG